MAESHVVSGLVAKRSEVSGLISHYQHEIARLQGDMQHLDATIKLVIPTHRFNDPAQESSNPVSRKTSPKRLF